MPSTTETPLHQGCSAKLRLPTRAVGRFIGEGGRNVKRLQLDREVMIQVDKSAAEAEVTGRQPDVDAIRQEIEPVAEASGRSMRRSCNGQGSSQSPGTIA